MSGGHNPVAAFWPGPAEWARGISPRASHRSGLDTLASSGSCHRTKAAAFRRELEVLLLPVGSLPTAMTCPLRSTSITPASSLQRNSPSAAARFRRRGNDLRAFHSLWVGKAGGELLRGSPPLSGASVLSASRLEPLAPFPLPSPARFSRSIQVDHRHCRPAADETGPRRQGSFFLEPGRASRCLHA